MLKATNQLINVNVFLKVSNCRSKSMESAYPPL